MTAKKKPTTTKDTKAAAKLERIERAIIAAAVTWKNQRETAMVGVPQSAYSTRADARLTHQIRRLQHERARQARARRAAKGSAK